MASELVKTRGFDAEEVHQARDAMVLRALDAEIRRRLSGP